MKKRVMLIVLAVLLVLTIAACGQKGIEGRWKLVGGEGGEFSDFEEIGADFIIELKGGTMKWEFDLSNSGMTDEEKQYAEAMLGMFTMATMTYKVVSDTELEMTISMMGETETDTVEYSLNGDTLIIEGTTFKRQ